MLALADTNAYYQVSHLDMKIPFLDGPSSALLSAVPWVACPTVLPRMGECSVRKQTASDQQSAKWPASFDAFQHPQVGIQPAEKRSIGQYSKEA